MIAPASMFDINYKQQKRSILRQAKILRRKDPAIFVKIESDKFLFLKEWGNSFSFFRRILGALTSKEKTLNLLFFTSWILYVIGSIILVKFLFQHGWVVTNTGDVRPVNWMSFAAFVYTAWAIVSSISWTFNASSGFFMRFFKDSDKGLWKVDEHLATENNWSKR